MANFFFLDPGGRVLILSLVADFQFWTLVADLCFWTLVANFGSWTLVTDFRYKYPFVYTGGRV